MHEAFLCICWSKMIHLCMSYTCTMNTFTELGKEHLFVANNIGREWRMLGRTLGIKESDIDQITNEHRHDLREQCRQCLITWMAKDRELATKEKLIKALREINQNYVADEVEDL